MQRLLAVASFHRRRVGLEERAPQEGGRRTCQRRSLFPLGLPRFGADMEEKEPQEEARVGGGGGLKAQLSHRDWFCVGSYAQTPYENRDVLPRVSVRSLLEGHHPCPDDKTVSFGSLQRQDAGGNGAFVLLGLSHALGEGGPTVYQKASPSVGFQKCRNSSNIEHAPV